MKNGFFHERPLDYDIYVAPALRHELGGDKINGHVDNARYHYEFGFIADVYYNGTTYRAVRTEVGADHYWTITGKVYEWHLELRNASSQYGDVDGTEPFTGTEQEAMLTAERWHYEVQGLRNYTVEILVINKATDECVYQGTFQEDDTEEPPYDGQETDEALDLWRESQ